MPGFGSARIVKSVLKRMLPHKPAGRRIEHLQMPEGIRVPGA